LHVTVSGSTPSADAGAIADANKAAKKSDLIMSSSH
jgi:hypothetical protein